MQRQEENSDSTRNTPPRWLLSEGRVLDQTVSPDNTRAFGLLASEIVLSTWSRSTSMREIVPSPSFATQTAPPPAATETGVGPTSIVATTEFVFGST